MMMVLIKSSKPTIGLIRSFNMNQIAPEDQIFVCGACGKTSEDMYDDAKHSYGWDVACMMNAVLCYKAKGPEGEWVAVDS